MSTSFHLLDTVASPADLRQLPREELPQLVEELRSFLVESVAKTGHLVIVDQAKWAMKNT